MVVKKIYFDMDGVLADFNRGVVELAGGTPLAQNDDPPAGADEAMWSRVRTVDHFYDKLELLPGAKQMFDMLYEKYGDKCEILSAIPKPRRGVKHAAEDKINWSHRVLSETLKVNIVYKEDKPQYCTGRDCILIDDLANNIRNWEKLGGTGIQHKSAEETIEILREMEVL